MNDRRKRRRKLRRRLQDRKQKLDARKPRSENENKNDPVVGYFAQADLTLLCDGDACVVVGHRRQMAAMIESRGFSADHFQIRKTTASEVIHGLQLGAAYCFDQAAFDRLLTPAQAAGLPLQQESIAGDDPDFSGVPLLRVQFPAFQLPALADDEGVHFAGPGEPSDQDTLDRMTQAYQQNIRNSPVWDMMVAEFGRDEAERMLKEFRAELR